MTKRQRAQVVELLRCAADVAVMGDRGSALSSAASGLGRCSMPFLLPVIGASHWGALLRGKGPVTDAECNGDVRHVCGKGYEFCLLEAAQRVEEGSWP